VGRLRANVAHRAPALLRRGAANGPLIGHPEPA